MSTLAFNEEAASYDADFTNSAIGQFQRNRVYKFLFPLLSKEKKIVEINCGTGHDAIELAKRCQSVFATDISDKMIEVAKTKQSSSGLNNIRFGVSNLTQLPDELTDSFDLLFSNFGGLNCVHSSDLALFSSRISKQINTKGKLVLVIMGKKCLWENVWYWWQNDSRLNRRNTILGIPTTIKRETFLTYYYSPKEIATIFSEHFTVGQIKPIGLFIPPSYLNSYFQKRPFFLKVLSLLETVFGSLPYVANYADHFLITLEKK